MDRLLQAESLDMIAYSEVRRRTDRSSVIWLPARSNCTNKNALNMKYGNFYDLESLTLLNRHEGCACSIKECDVEKVNRRDFKDAGGQGKSQFTDRRGCRHLYYPWR